MVNHADKMAQNIQYVRELGSSEQYLMCVRTKIRMHLIKIQIMSAQRQIQRINDGK